MPNTFRQTTTLSTSARLAFFLVAIISQARSQSSVETEDSDAVDADPFLVFPYRLSCACPIGKITDDALPGSEVPVDTCMHVNSDQSRFVRLKLYQNRHLEGDQIVRADNDTENSTTDLATIESLRLLTLPQGLLWDVSGDDTEGSNVVPPGIHEDVAFTINNDFNVIVSNPDKYAGVVQVEFWVVLIRRRKGSEDEVVSNPVAFIVHIEHKEPVPEGAAVYVGVVVLAVCLFALLIPLTVRTKRRMREGKPLCACGSSGRKKAERNTALEPAKDDDIAILYSEGVDPPASASRRHESIQAHNLRSVSEPHFQPLWLDPHYKHEHERPNYKANPTPKTSVASSSSSAGPPAASSSSAHAGHSPSSYPSARGVTNVVSSGAIPKSSPAGASKSSCAAEASPSGLYVKASTSKSAQKHSHASTAATPTYRKKDKL